jgi:hypothetical protein
VEEEDRAGEKEGRRGWAVEEEDMAGEDMAGEEEGKRCWPVEEEDRAGRRRAEGAGQ